MVKLIHCNTPTRSSPGLPILCITTVPPLSQLFLCNIDNIFTKVLPKISTIVWRRWKGGNRCITCTKQIFSKALIENLLVLFNFRKLVCIRAYTNFSRVGTIEYPAGKKASNSWRPFFHISWVWGHNATNAILRINFLQPLK